MKLWLLADLHIGAIKDMKYMYDVTTELIDREVRQDPCDAVILLGDYFDRLFRLNEEFVGLAVNLMSYLVRACAQNKTKIRIIYGTESHEMGQYRIFNHHFSSNRIDMKLIDTCTEEELFPGVQILYLPEEYMEDKMTFYQDTIFSGKKYDYIFGHGMIMDGMPESIALSKTVSAERQVPRFVSQDFAQTDALVAFGHYHQHADITEKVHYVGSLFRWQFGEDTPKGYAIIRDGVWEFHENPYAYPFRTYHYPEDSPIYQNSEALMKELHRIQQENEDILSGETDGRIRLEFHLPEHPFDGFQDAIRGVLLNNKKVKTVWKDSQPVVEASEDPKDTRFDFIMDPSMDISDKIHAFMDMTMDPEFVVSPEVIRRYITNELTL